MDSVGINFTNRTQVVATIMFRIEFDNSEFQTRKTWAALVFTAPVFTAPVFTAFSSSRAATEAKHRAKK